MNETQNTGVCIDLFSKEKMRKMGPAEKISLIIDAVRDNKIIILEAGLSPEEESQLIVSVMKAIEHHDDDRFTGIEIESYPRSEDNSGFMGRLLGGKESKDTLTIIGPSERIQTLHKDSEFISAFISQKEA